MPMYNLLEYSDNYSMRSGSLWYYYKDELNHRGNEIDNANNRINNQETIRSKSFEYKAKIIGRTPIDNNTLDTEVAVPLKYLSNFWRFLDLPLIICEIELDFSWSKKCIMSEISTAPRKPTNPNANPQVQEVAAIQTT